MGSNANLDRVGRENGLDCYINVNPSQVGVISPVTMTATVEAILGAVYLDGGMDMVQHVMAKLGLGPHSLALLNQNSRAAALNFLSWNATA